MGDLDVESAGLRSFAANLRHWAAEQPDAPAVTVAAAGEDDVTLTYGELDRASNRVAQRLAALGVGHGSRLAHLGRNRMAYPLALYAASKLGATIVGLNWRLGADELAPLLADSDPLAVLVDDEFGPAAETAIGRSAVSPRLVSEREIAEWADDSSGSDLDPYVALEPSDIGLIFYTSGTTGTPKGAMLSVGAISNHLARPAPWTMGPGSTTLVCSPMFHTAGTGWVYLPGFHGAHCVVLRDPSMAEILARLERHGITETLLVPTVIRMLLDEPQLAHTDLSALRTMVYGASPIAPSTLARAIEAFGCHFVQAYGMTETGGPICYLDPADHDATDPHGRLRSAGRPLEGVEVAVVDLETGEPCPTGAYGEVWTRSDQQMSGYLNRPDATAATLTTSGWLRTGDGGYFDADGYLFLTDRLSDMIVSGAENVYPLEVENVLASHPDVADVAVVGVPDDKWGETVVAVVVPTPTGGDAAALIAYARERLAHYKSPTRVDFVAELPKNPAGKVLRRILRQERNPQGTVR